MNRGWSGLLVATSLSLLVAIADRDTDNSTAVAVHTSSFVAIEPQGKTRKDGDRMKFQADRAIGVIREEALPAKQEFTISTEPSWHASLPNETDAASTSAAVKQAIRALIEFSNKSTEAVQQVKHESALKVKNILHNSSKPLSWRSNLSGGLAESPAQPQVKTFGNDGHGQDWMNTYVAGDSSLAATSIMSDLQSHEGKRASTAQEILLTSSTAEPNKAIEELERHSTSILSVVFFTYLLLSLTAGAACAAFMAHRQQQSIADSSETQMEKDRWKHILHYGSFGNHH